MNASDRTPRLTVGLPVYNGEKTLRAALDALLAQSFTDFELLIADNASTDGTQAIAESYVAADPRVRYIRHALNRGVSYNHNCVIEQARGELFKWASDDDLYAPDLLERCVSALDTRPEVVLAHAWTAFIDGEGNVTEKRDYPLTTDVPSPRTRFRSLLHTPGGDDIYGVIRMSVLRRIAPYGSFHLPDRTFVAELALHGRFHNDPDFLYFRRDHPGRVEREATSVRDRAAIGDPRRANPWLHPAIRLYAEYVLAYITGIWRAPLSVPDKLGCTRDLLGWLLGHVNPLRRVKLLQSPDPAVRALARRSRAVQWFARRATSRSVPADGGPPR